MKRYERMTKENIIDLFKGIDDCCTCMFSNSKNECTLRDKDCCEGIRDYLNEEIKLKTVSRWQAIKSDEDLKKMGAEFNIMCSKESCDTCEYNNERICFVGYLLEKIEVEETE